jgi:RimJ/RimL family protein N-acetyltransferase
VVDGEVVGWVDADPDAGDWLRAGEVNVGYCVFAGHRGRGYATRAVELLLEQLTDVTTAVLLIDADNAASLGVARRAGFAPTGEMRGQQRWERPVGTS